MKRKKKFFKKKSFRKRPLNNPLRYTGQLNVACETSKPLY